MNESDVSQLENTFGVRFPKGYRQLLLTPPNLLVALMKAFAEEQDDLSVPMVLNFDAIQALNEEARDSENGLVFDEENEDVPWPNEYFIIGADCGGNRYCIKPTSERSTVYEWDHSGGDNFEQVADSMTEYVEHWFKEIGEIAAMDCVDDESA